MIILNFSELPPIGYRNIFKDCGIPALIKIKKNVEVIFQNHFEKEYRAIVDQAHKEVFLNYPIIRIGGDCLAFAHIMIDLSEYGNNDYVVKRIQYFSSGDGWSDLIFDGKFKEIEREPDPDWL